MAVLALGFRPFFLLAGIAATLAMLLWMLRLAGNPLDEDVTTLAWHSHELIFGFGGAVVAGFLLTAARNWTNLPTATGFSLAFLVGLWLAGRVLPWVPLPISMAGQAIVDASFFIAVAAFVVRPVVRARQWKSLAFPVLLLVLAGADAATHLAAPGGHGGLLFGLYTLVMMMTVMGARVIPFFTERRLTDCHIRRPFWLDRATEAATAAAALALFAAAGSAGTALLCFAAALAHGARSVLWHDRLIWSVPLLWVLHVGYAWIGIGFALAGLSALGLASPYAVLHAHSVGALGVLALGMMARVSLGHTGRPLEPPSVMRLAFAAVALAAVIRVFGPILAPSLHFPALIVSGALWLFAYALFTIMYAPMLVRPRADGRPE